MTSCAAGMVSMAALSEDHRGIDGGPSPAGATSHAPNATANYCACHPPRRWCRCGCCRWMAPGRRRGFRQGTAGSARQRGWSGSSCLRSVKWALLVALAGTAGIGLIGLGLGAIVRHGAAAIAVLFALVFAAPLFGLAQTGARKSRPSSSTRTRWTLTSRRRGHAVAVGRAEHHLRLCRGAAYGRRLAAEPPGRVSGTMRLWTPAAW